MVSIGGIKSGVEKGGKQVDTQVVFYADREKIVCHLYNTTCLILVNGHGYRKLIELFLKPFFQAKADSCQEEIGKYNEFVLDKLCAKRIKRGDIKYKGGSSFPCNRCDYAGKNISTLNKHKKTDHTVSFNIPESLMGPKQSTRNNSVIENIMLEDMTASELDNVTINLDENALKFTCIDCKFATTSKECMDKHVRDTHLANEDEEVKYSCTKCGHDFKEVENYNAHVKMHEVPCSVKLVSKDTEITILENLIYCEILECFVGSLHPIQWMINGKVLM